MTTTAAAAFDMCYDFSIIGRRQRGCKRAIAKGDCPFEGRVCLVNPFLAFEIRTQYLYEHARLNIYFFNKKIRFTRINVSKSV